MSRRAWTYIWFVLLIGVGLAILAFPGFAPTPDKLLQFAILAALATFAQLFRVEAPNHQLYVATLVFLFAGMLLLHPFFFVLLVVTCYGIQWIKERLSKSRHLRNWYLQPFNVSAQIIAATVARGIVFLLRPADGQATSLQYALAMVAAAIAYTLLNHLIIGMALVLARGVKWKESGILDLANLASDFVLLLQGAVVAMLWDVNLWFVPLAISPLELMFRALQIPQLKKEAQTDDKTGLLNARHFSQSFGTEVERAKRFGRPLALIMADLDLLRNINNTYGHLAGDLVLSGIGNIIRATIREYDLAARFGGEEFTIALPETGLPEAQAIAERLRHTVANMEFEVKTSPVPIHATMSFGVACFPSDAVTPNDLIHQADVAVYQAKLRGRNCIVCSAEIPHSIKLEVGATDDRLESPSSPIVPRELSPFSAEVEGNLAQAESASTKEHAAPGRTYPQALAFFVASVIALGGGITLYDLTRGQPVDPLILVILAGIAVLAELFQVRLYGDSTFSVSVTVSFAAALTGGILGVAVVSAAIALTHYVRNRRIQFYKVAFNWATHVLAGSMTVLAFSLFAFPLATENLLPLLLLTVISALAYYIVESGLVTAAISLSEGVSPIATWREQFGWMAFYYLVLCLMGLFMTLAYVGRNLGILGTLVFVLPMLMIYYAQKQYVDRTAEGMRELQRMNQELGTANREILAANKTIHSSNEELLHTLSKMIDARDPYVQGHSEKVADYATAIAAEMGLSVERLEGIRQAAYMHDIGKIAISEHVLNKPSRLNAREYEYLRTHPALGAEFLQGCHSLRHLAPFIRHHHEWWDGSGYPDNLAGEQIPLEARIIALGDAVESMASDRPYHHAMQLEEIVAEIESCAGKQFDPVVAGIFIRILRREGRDLVVNSAREVVKKTGGREPAPHWAGGASLDPA